MSLEELARLKEGLLSMGVIKWSEMTPDQRDRLVHERVMGHSPDEECSGIFWATTDTQTGERGSQCSGCGMYYPVDDTIEYYKHQQPNAPSYTTDMNAALSLVARMYQEHRDKFWLALMHLITPKNNPPDYINSYMSYVDFYALFRGNLEITAQTFCIAALQTCGVEIEV